MTAKPDLNKLKALELAVQKSGVVNRATHDVMKDANEFYDYFMYADVELTDAEHSTTAKETKRPTRKA